MEGQTYIKNKNGLKFKIVSVKGTKVHFHENGYFNLKIMEKNTFLDQFTLEVKDEK